VKILLSSPARRRIYHHVVCSGTVFPPHTIEWVRKEHLGHGIPECQLHLAPHHPEWHTIDATVIFSAEKLNTVFRFTITITKSYLSRNLVSKISPIHSSSQSAELSHIVVGGQAEVSCPLNIYSLQIRTVVLELLAVEVVFNLPIDVTIRTLVQLSGQTSQKSIEVVGGIQ